MAAQRTPTAEGSALGVTSASVAFDYDRAGRLLAGHGAEGTVAYEQDALDTITALNLPHGQRFGLLSYGAGHVHQIRMGERVVCDVGRDDLRREVLRTQGRLTLRTGCDALGRRSWAAAGVDPDAPGPAAGQSWRSDRCDRLGELATQEDGVRGRLDHRYDPAGHLLRQVRNVDGGEERFTWDAAGNLLAGGADKSAGLVEGNRLKVWRAIRFDYDPWGNVSHKRKGSRLAVFDSATTPEAGCDKVALAAAIYHFQTDAAGTPLELTDEAGGLAWAGKCTAWGKVEQSEDALPYERTGQPLRFAGQHADDAPGLHYNTFRCYDPDVGRYISQDPIGLSGGLNLYAWVPNPMGWTDPWGWVSEHATGYVVHGLYAPGSDKPYHVGETDDVYRRGREHTLSGRLPSETSMKPIAEDLTHGKARGIEQAHMEHSGTKTGAVGFDLKQAVTYEQRGNKVASFDHGNTTRPAARQAYFAIAYRNEMATLSGGCG